jgi:hypothetical protein
VISRIFWRRLLQKESYKEEVEEICHILEVMAMDVFAKKWVACP